MGYSAATLPPGDSIRAAVQGLPCQVSLRCSYEHGMLATGQQLIAESGVVCIYSVFGPTFKQILYTSAELGFQQKVAEATAPLITLGGSPFPGFEAVFSYAPHGRPYQGGFTSGYANGIAATGQKLRAENGVVNHLYSGFNPMLCQQNPYTTTRFSVLHSLGTSPSEINKGAVLPESLGSGAMTCVAVATLSYVSDDGSRPAVLGHRS